MLIIVLICLNLHPIWTFEFLLGDCPVYYEEPCRTDLVKFAFSAGGTSSNYTELNPFKPLMPRDFNPLLPFKVLVHGYGGLKFDKAIKAVLRAYQALRYNVVIVDWGPLSNIPCYATSFLNTWHVGQCIAILAVSLLPYGIKPNNLHLIGFSLGAHIAGFTGQNLQKVLKTSVGRITGLDPALPLFATLNNEWKLNAADAKFVDVVHTSAGSFGKIEAIGDVDFYMNGGVIQPMCYEAPYPAICSHMMAGLYFAETILYKKYIGVECNNIGSYIVGGCDRGRRALMGEYTSQRTRGSFYVTATNSTLAKLKVISYT